MPHRDPQTGQFVSDDMEHFDRALSLHGRITYTIPAVDLGGGAEDHTVDGDEAEILDLDNEIDSDETFEVRYVRIESSAGAATTATAEGSMFTQWALRTDSETLEPASPGGPYSGSANREEGDIDVSVNELGDTTAENVIAIGVNHAENSAADSTNGLGLGAMYDHSETVVDYTSAYGGGIQLDANDNLSVPAKIDVNNVSDNAVYAAYTVSVYGVVREGC